MLFKCEMKKLLSNKIFCVMLVLLSFSIALSMYNAGYLGHDYCVTMDEFSYKDGKLLTGSKAYSYNKALANSYRGVVNEKLLEKLHNEFKSNPHAVLDGVTYYNSVYSYFKTVFNIEEESYLGIKDVYSSDSIIYGFTGDWTSLFEVLDKFFLLFIVTIILFVSPVFSMEHESGIVDLLGTTYIGKTDCFLKRKLKAVVVCVNCALFIFLIFILGVHIFRYGFDNYDVSIQSCVKYVNSMLDMNLGQFCAYKVIAGILGCNLVCLITFMISLYNRGTFTCFIASALIIGGFSRNILLRLIGINVMDYILAFAPINSFKLTIVAIVPDMLYVYALYVGYIVLIALFLHCIKACWCTKKFYEKK